MHPIIRSELDPAHLTPRRAVTLALCTAFAVVCLTAVAGAQSGGAWVGPPGRTSSGGMDANADGVDDSVAEQPGCFGQPCDPGPGCAGETCLDCIGLGGGTEGSPVLVKTGDYNYEQTDIVITGRGPDIVIHRVYNSHDMYAGPTGYGWHFSLVIRLIRETLPDGEYATIIGPDAARVRFRRDGTGNTFGSPPGHYERLTLISPNYQLSWSDGSVWIFAADGWIESITDPNGNALVFQYDSFVQPGFRFVKSVTQQATGRSVTVGWDFGAGRITAITDHTGRTVSYGYDSGGYLISVEDVADKSWTYEYRAFESRRMLERVAFEGVTYASASYDGSWRAIGYSENGEDHTYEYQPTQTVKRDPAGNEWQYETDGHGVIGRVVDPTGADEQSTWRPDYFKLQQREEDGGIWEYAGTGNRIETMTRRVGELQLSWNMSYENPLWPNKPTKIVGPSGWGGTWISYDDDGNETDIGRVLSDGTPAEVLLHLDREPHGDVSGLQDAAAARTDYVHDSFGDVTQVFLPANNGGGLRPDYEYVHDGLGRVLTAKDPMDRETHYQYDAYGRITQMTLPNPGTGATGFVWNWTYDEKVGEQFKSTVTDPNGAVTQIFEDVWGHTRKIVDAANHETTIDWDQGRPVEIVDAEGNVTTYSYNSRGLLETILHPNGRTTQFTYTPTGQLGTRTDRKGQVTQFTYDELGRLKTRQYPDGTMTYTYEGPNLVSVSDTTQPLGQQNSGFQYDTRGRLTQTTEPGGHTVGFTWLDGDRLGSYQVDSDSPIRYTYYPNGSLHTIKRDSDVTGFEYTYRIEGLCSLLTYPNSSRVDYQWDELGRLLVKSNINLDSSQISRYTYGYDLNHAGGGYTRKGLRTSMIEEVGGTLVGEEQYFFDTLSQLTRALYANGDDHSWTYDDIGNQTSFIQAIPGHDPIVRYYSYYPNSMGGNSQLLGSDGLGTYHWDDNGNLQSVTIPPGGTKSFTWNPRDQLTGISGPDVAAAYRYNFSGFRTQKTVGTDVTDYLYSQDWHILKETTGGNTSDHVFGADVDEILNKRMTGADYFYYTDALGSVRQINTSAGVLANSYGYDAWGTEGVDSTVTIPNSFLYTGREAGEADLLYYRARYLAPGIGRFITEDPLGLGIAQLGAYVYVANSPFNSTDPSGLDRYVIVVGDPGLNNPLRAHDVGTNFDRAAQTRKEELGLAGHVADLVRASSISDVINAIGSGPLIDGGVIYYGHGGPAILYVGEQSGSWTNIDQSNIALLPWHNLSPGATVELRSCWSGMGGPLSIAELLANQLRVRVIGWDSPFSFSDNPTRRFTGQRPPENGPLYMIPDWPGTTYIADPPLALLLHY